MISDLADNIWWEMFSQQRLWSEIKMLGKEEFKMPEVVCKYVRLWGSHQWS